MFSTTKRYVETENALMEEFEPLCHDSYFIAIHISGECLPISPHQVRYNVYLFVLIVKKFLEVKHILTDS